MNFNNVDPRSEPLFLGESLSLQRYDRLKYPTFYKLAQAQEKQYWQAEEVSLLKDRNDYKALTPVEKFIFDSNLKYQTLGDSCLSRSIDTIKAYVSNPELEACFGVWSFFESNIHSRSYSHILKNVYADESVFWDSILEDKEIINRLTRFTSSYDNIFEDDAKSLRHRIFNAIVETNVTESLSFYVSFACSFFFAAKGVMEGNGKIIKFIEKDEILHAAITTELLKIFKDVPEEGFQDIYDEAKIVESFRVGVENEKQWADYLFSQGDLLGLTIEQFKLFAEYRANERLAILKIDPIFEKQKQNPLGSWYQEFIRPKAVQVAPQESELGANYLIGARDSSIAKDDFEGFEL